MSQDTFAGVNEWEQLIERKRQQGAHSDPSIRALYNRWADELEATLVVYRSRLSALRSRYAGDASLTGREVLGVLREVEGEK